MSTAPQPFTVGRVVYTPEEMRGRLPLYAFLREQERLVHAMAAVVEQDVDKLKFSQVLTFDSRHAAMRRMARHVRSACLKNPTTCTVGRIVYLGSTFRKRWIHAYRIYRKAGPPLVLEVPFSMLDLAKSLEGSTVRCQAKAFCEERHLEIDGTFFVDRGLIDAEQAIADDKGDPNAPDDEDPGASSPDEDAPVEDDDAPVEDDDAPIEDDDAPIEDDDDESDPDEATPC